MCVQTFHTATRSGNAACGSMAAPCRRQLRIAEHRVALVCGLNEERVQLDLGPANTSSGFEMPNHLDLQWTDQPVASGHWCAICFEWRVSNDHRNARFVSHDHRKRGLRETIQE